MAGRVKDRVTHSSDARPQQCRTRIQRKDPAPSRGLVELCRYSLHFRVTCKSRALATIAEQKYHQARSSTPVLDGCWIRSWAGENRRLTHSPSLIAVIGVSDWLSLDKRIQHPWRVDDRPDAPAGQTKSPAEMVHVAGLPWWFGCSARRASGSCCSQVIASSLGPQVSFSLGPLSAECAGAPWLLPATRMIPQRLGCRGDSLL